MLDLFNLPLAALAAVAALFAAVALAVMGLGGLVPRGGIHRQADPAAASVRFSRGSRLYGRMVRPLADKLVPKQGKDVGVVRRRLLRAGWYSPHAVPVYFVARLMSALALPFAFTMLAPLLAKDLDLKQLALGSIALAAIGYFTPAAVVNHRMTQRQTAIRRGFPDALDLLLVCVEAGLGLDAAINRVAQEIGGAHPLLGEHFHLMALELQTGKSREQALRSLADRIGVDEVDALTTLLVQSDALGASIADTLRALADDMRARRMLMAEEKAQQVGVKLTFPLILMIMPALMLTVGAPAIIQLIRRMGPVLTNMGG